MYNRSDVMLQKKEVFVLGQSVSLQWGEYFQKYLGKGYAYRHKTGQEAPLRHCVAIQSENGGDSRAVLQYLDLMKADLHPDMLLVGAGLHDIRRNRSNGTIQVSLSEYRENLERIIERGRECSMHLVWMTTTSFDESAHNDRAEGHLRFLEDNIAYHDAAVSVMNRSHIPFVDIRAFTEGILCENKYDDHVHFSKHVRKKQAEFVAQWVKHFSL